MCEDTFRIISGYVNRFTKRTQVLIFNHSPIDVISLLKVQNEALHLKIFITERSK